ncbi:MAG: hypothetical protein EON47_00330 [Acetobacteraceae bacterium]|nr:MAG: hypothetical protein EON47_00330 [Acetobacteraceae bacterium]
MAPRRRPRGDQDLPTAAKLILRDYQDFIAGGADDGEAKLFAARHAAARAALAHLEQVLKLANDAGTAEEVREVAASITEWRARMPPQAQEEPDADDAGPGC